MVTMQALKFSESCGLLLEKHHEKPTAAADEASIRVIRAGVCSTDLEILKGYVPGYDHILGHEFVGVVESCASRPQLEGKRVVGEINCACSGAEAHPDPIFNRNHSPGRTVLGIIGRNGTMAEYLTLPVVNLHLVPDQITDKEACFAEPLAAACRIAEQQVSQKGDKVAVIGDGKLGLLVAQALVVQGHTGLVHFGKHEHKLSLVQGSSWEVVDDSTSSCHAQEFDVVVEASGSSQGITLASAMTRPMGTLILKSTCSALNDPDMPVWSNIANDIVVNEKRLQGSRCGPFGPALEALQDARLKQLLEKMVTQTFHISDGVKAIEKAQTKGVLKVQIIMQ
ncbi:GroES-like protein [Coccomyxa subellipsoidea C-169]|uniref:GroES-like protein n=1 Tax=Coccomyxa subellipsoidea (strain C-169) TaxID=574566 RepID=I0YYS7_COCSC|nr:GroES-like protein [Coccomyxa subellipsoidea C-169]EIE23546.1 GroES-like protein [Coccomyxa subellipsoidea C-169]|eukprot:XP_005648090.1 GroES-like protein [Coccomyxa subellipsoidea C-169]